MSSPFLPQHKLLFLLILLTGIFLRFYNINWGAPFYFHPDERNIASTVSQLSFPTQLNPHFFAYGSFPIYSIYFTGIVFNAISILLHLPSDDQLISIKKVSFEYAIIISRLYSVLFSTLLLLVLYKVGIVLKNTKTALIALFLSATSVGFIQFAHFGTFEMWLAFFSLLLLYFSIQYIKTFQYKYTLLSFLTLGLLISIKISSLILFPVSIFTLTIVFCKEYIKTSEIQRIKIIRNYFAHIFVLLVVVFCVYVLTNPYVLSDFQSFKSSMQYEANLAIGKLPVFYTGEFYHTPPVLFQFTRIYPFLLNPIITILFIPSLMYAIYLAFRKKSASYFLLLTSYLLLFFSQAFLFAKWTRYMVPTLPFIYVIIAIGLTDFLNSLKRNTSQWDYQYTSILVYFLFISTYMLYATAYVITVFTRPDSRITASIWAKKNIPADAKILSEVYDLGITPFNPYFASITLFNFYDLEQVPSKKEELDSLLKMYDYIVLPSQRIIKPSLLHPEKFPEQNKFYSALLSGQLGYGKIYQTPCDILCKITYMGDPVFSFEETVNVFDRPTVYIFKKQILNSKYTY